MLSSHLQGDGGAVPYSACGVPHCSTPDLKCSKRCFLNRAEHKAPNRACDVTLINGD